MKGLFQGRNLLFLASMGNLMLWCFVTFVLLGGCALGQQPYYLSPIGPFHWDFDQAHPVLWWFNYVHTCTLLLSFPLAIVFILRLGREDGEGLREARSRLRKSNFRRSARVDAGPETPRRGRRSALRGPRGLLRSLFRGFPRTSLHRNLGETED